MKRAFICYNTINSELVIGVSHYLMRNFDDVYYYEDYRNNEIYKSISEEVGKKIVEFEVFIAFIGKDVTSWQSSEISTVIHINNNRRENSEKIIIPVLVDVDMLPSNHSLLIGYKHVKIDSQKNLHASHIAKEIVEKAGLRWKAKDGLPAVSNYFYYEKNILKDYINLLQFGDNLFSETEDTEETKEIKTDLRKKLRYGLPSVWPHVTKISNSIVNYHNNTVKGIGEARHEDAKVVAAALTSFHPESTCIYKNQLTFPEAGPRKKLFYPREDENLRVAILVSGGIAPGINSVINGITQRHEQYANDSEISYRVNVYGLQNGFYAFDDYHVNKKYLD
ncbi:MAG: TIR domain-containing protein, partial [Bacteroidales bacterium]|nr:TIR domain-containing protein [Bacteroidales bacterium]